MVEYVNGSVEKEIGNLLIHRCVLVVCRRAFCPPHVLSLSKGTTAEHGRPPVSVRQMEYLVVVSK